MLFPEAQQAVDAEAGAAPIETDADIARSRAESRAEATAAPREPVAEVQDHDAGGVLARRYRPEGARPGTIVHLHGGGFVFNDVEVHDAAARALANRTGLTVLSVDYRLAPEHPFPAAPDDVDTVLTWMLDQPWAAEGPTYLHGDSAGANLALVAALRHPGRARALVLVYPFLEPRGGWPSYEQTGTGFSADQATWFWERYASEDQYDDPDVAPLRSSGLGGLPPTFVVTAEHDPLRDEGEELARRLAEERVPVVSTRYQGLIHGFWRHPQQFPAVELVLAQTAAFLAAHP